MLPLLTALSTNDGLPCSKSIARALCQLSISSLGRYVVASDPALRKQDRTHATTPQSFTLDELLHTTWPPKSFGEWFRADVVGCSTLYLREGVEVSWFLLPPGGMLPLHDHCLMKVWQRVLHGSIRVTSIDWKTKCSLPAEARQRQQHGGEAIVVNSSDVSAHPSSSDPSLVASFGPVGGGVLHEIINNSSGPALFIDVISPTYHTWPNYFECKYYEALPCNASQTRVAQSGAGSANSIADWAREGQCVMLTPRVGDYPFPMTSFIPLDSPL
uniref:Cysteine dioxygenase n=1 Tax=Trypanosoma congolense (strain IL3000) TaxID=1068625 RepID=G0UQK6_TRYCI|nr:conserved hypothetical protein [Trypanosoma congolense IL3000]